MAQRTGEAGAGEEDPRKAQLKAMFSRLAGSDGEVDAEELQDILTASLTKGREGERREEGGREGGREGEREGGREG